MSQGFCTAYTPGPETAKLAELRAKTDRQILRLLHSRLEVGLNFVALVEQTYTDGNPDHAEQLLMGAEEAVIEVKRLLPVLTKGQYRSVGPKLNELREALDRQRHCERPRSATATMS
jgi:hypothetical protein